MSTTIRTDSHRPSAIVPNDYRYVACECVKIEGLGDCLFIQQQRELINRHMERTGGTYSRHEHGGNCHVCGSVNMIYSILYYHEKSNSYIRVGEDCAQKLDLGGTADMNRFRAAVQDARKAKAGKAKAQAILAESGLSRAWEVYQASNAAYVEGTAKNEERIICDIVGKLVRYGSISVNQGAFLGKLIDQIGKRAERATARAIENEAAANCPTGRIVVTGTVLSTKFQDSPWGGGLKMLVKDDSGFKVWCTVPGYNELEKGSRISFTVSVEPSRDDPKFGFGKRPAKLTVINQGFATCPHGDDGANCSACAAEAAPAVS